MYVYIYNVCKYSQKSYMSFANICKGHVRIFEKRLCEYLQRFINIRMQKVTLIFSYNHI